MSDYEFPEVWQWEDENTEKSGNRPTAGVVSTKLYPSERLRFNFIH